MKQYTFFNLLILGILTGFINSVSAQSINEKPLPRIVITADPELDDNNSLIRFLLYSTDVTIEGLVYSNSQFHWKGDGKGTRWFVPGREYDRFGMGVCPCESWRWSDDERFIHDIVDAYEKVYQNLIIHNPNYPAPDYLRSKIRYGNIEFDGDISKDTPGSELIKSLILDNEPGKLFITAWGGHSTIARALKSIQDQYEFTTEWQVIKDKVYRKVVLLPSGDQDNTYASYIKPNWPGIEYRQFREGPSYGYGAQINASTENAPYLTPTWMQENVTQYTPLGDLYRVWGDGKQMVEGDKVDYFGLSGYTNEELREQGYFVWLPVQAKGSWLGEGDNHTFMNMLGNGLRAHENGSYGGWGGRVINPEDDSNAFLITNDSGADQMAETISSSNDPDSDNTAYPNFFPQAQRDFAARMKWSVTNKYAEANHQPTVKIEGPTTLIATPGQRLKLYGNAKDSDGDELKYRWWQFMVGSYSANVEIKNPNSLSPEFVVPEDAKDGETIHIVFEVTDNGEPALTRYQRVIITVDEN